MRYVSMALAAVCAFVIGATNAGPAWAQKAEQCRDERRKGGQGPQTAPTDLIFIQNEVAVPVYYRVRNWEHTMKQTELPKANAGKCIRVPFPASFEKLRSISVEVSVKMDDRDKCNVNIPIGYKIVVEGERERIKCRIAKHEEGK